MTNKRTPWTPAENAALVSLYFTMLDRQTTGQNYTKAALIRRATGADQVDPRSALPFDAQLANRSRPSIEFKLMNASAAHADLDPGAETMDGHGYRAMPNYQATLKDAMRDALDRREKISRLEGYGRDRMPLSMCNELDDLKAKA